MLRKIVLRLAVVLPVLILLAAPLTVSAHTTVPAGGNYNLEYGWSNEPALVNQPNAVIINISDKNVSEGATPDPNAPAFTLDVSSLKVEVDYGGQSKQLTLTPLPDGEPGQYVASFIPTQPGQYTVKITGKLTGSVGDADVNLSVNPEDVETVDAYAFPAITANTSSAGSFGLSGWLAIAGIVVGLAAIALAALALMRKK